MTKKKSLEGTIVATLEVVVDHDESVEEMVKAGGYNYANDNITDGHFPHPREGEERVIIDLVKFDQVGTTAERERQLAVHGDLAEMDDMLALGVQHPDQQRQYPIVFLGSAWVDPDGHRCVGYLWGDGSKRHCNLYWGAPSYRWDAYYVFAVRRRKSGTSDTENLARTLTLGSDNIIINGITYIPEAK